MKRFLILTGCMLAGIVGSAQVMFQFMPEVYGRNVDGLSSVMVQNMGNASIDGSVVIGVREMTKNNRVLTLTTARMTLRPGNNQLSKLAFNNSIFQFAKTSYGALVNQTKTFPPGEYEFCFRFVPTSKDLDESENCVEGSILPLVPISLILPAEGDTICEKRPLLTWQPPLPFHQSMRFRLLLTEKGDDAPAEALMKRRPLVLLDNLSGSSINFPANHPELQEGKTYVWQVAAYQQGLIISTSEVWEFTVKCKEDAPPPPPNESYRELKVLVSGNYYIANRYLQFRMLNNYNVKELRYTITDPATGKEIERLPKVPLVTGNNNISIDLTDLDLKPGKQYVLTVRPFNESDHEVRFTYRNE